jgi:hypothetical protein
VLTLFRWLGITFLLVVWLLFGLIVPLALWPSWSAHVWVYAVVLLANVGAGWEMRRILRRWST